MFFSDDNKCIKFDAFILHQKTKVAYDEIFVSILFTELIPTPACCFL